MSDSNDDPYVVAKKLGKVVIFPAANELQLDIDSEGDLVSLKKKLDACAWVGLEMLVSSILPSKTNKHWHAVITVPPWVDLTPTTRIALQAILGSDWKREMLGLNRILQGNNPIFATLFFENPKEVPLPIQGQEPDIEW